MPDAALTAEELAAIRAASAATEPAPPAPPITPAVAFGTLEENVLRCAHALERCADALEDIRERLALAVEKAADLDPPDR